MIATVWAIDTSFLIHAIHVGKIDILILLRSPTLFPEYVFKFELGVNARPETRTIASELVKRKKVRVEQLTLSDLDRLAELGAPRRIGLGELACALIAERMSGGVVCDDWKAHAWIKEKAKLPIPWDSIEGVLLQAASDGYLNEFDLEDCQNILSKNKYKCRYNNLRVEFLRRRTSQSGSVS